MMASPPSPPSPNQPASPPAPPAKPLPPLPNRPPCPPAQPVVAVHVCAVHEYPLPNSNPALGLAAVPSPMKTRITSAIGLAVRAPVAEAAGDTTAPPATPISDATAGEGETTTSESAAGAAFSAAAGAGVEATRLAKPPGLDSQSRNGAGSESADPDDGTPADGAGVTRDPAVGSAAGRCR